MSAYGRFCATKWLNIGVRVRLTEVSAEHRFILQQMWEERLGTQAGVHLIALMCRNAGSGENGRFDEISSVKLTIFMQITE